MTGFRALFRARGGRSCGCGHAKQTHEHYRRGTDCAMCDCARFKAGAANGGTRVETVNEPVSEPQTAAPEAARDRVTSSRLAS